MKKIIMVAFIGASILLTACSSNKEETKIENTKSEQLKENEFIATVEIENKVEDDEIIEYSFSPADLACSIPSEFVESDQPGLYVVKKSKKDISYIDHTIQETSSDPTLVDKDEYELLIEAEYSDAYGDAVDIEITQFDKMEVEGRPGLWIMYNFYFRSERYEVLELILFNGTEADYLTFVQGPKAEWMEKYVAAATSVTYIDKED